LATYSDSFRDPDEQGHPPLIGPRLCEERLPGMTGPRLLSAPESSTRPLKNTVSIRSTYWEKKNGSAAIMEPS
jgi:hypothetical protein